MSSCNYPSSHGILDYLDENNFFSFLTTATFVIIGGFLYIVSLYRYFEKQNIPRISQPSAPYGNIKKVIDKDASLFQLLSKYYNSLKKKDCTYGGMYFFFKPGIVIVDISLVNEILLNETIFRDLSRNEIDGDKFLSEAEFEMNLESLGNIIRNDFIESLKTNTDLIQCILHKFVIDSTCNIFGLKNNLFDTNLLIAAERDYTSSSLKTYLTLVYSFFKQRTLQEWHAVIEQNILFRKKNDIRNKDLLQNLIEFLNKTGKKSKSSVDIFINSFIQNVIVSYYTTLFCLYELSKDTDIQEQLIGEIRRFNCNDNCLSGLSYLDAVVKETLRKYPPVPVIIKQCTENYVSSTVGPKFTKGNLVIIPTSAIHYDGSIYVDPENFDPDRFLEDEIENKSTFLPFGSLNKKYKTKYGEYEPSMVLMKLLLVSIFSHFKVKLTNKNYYLSFDSGKMNMQPTKPLPLKLDPLL